MSGADATIDAILDEWRDALGAAHGPYRNHAQRVFHLARSRAGDERTLAVAAAFHDLGIWSDATFDYLEPSVTRAADWLAARGESSRLAAVAALIRFHHTLTPYRGPHAAAVEAFRRADLADVSMGLIPGGLPRRDYRALRRRFPYLGFHRMLIGLTWREFRRHPLRPLPMLRW